MRTIEFLAKKMDSERSFYYVNFYEGLEVGECQTCIPGLAGKVSGGSGTSVRNLAYKTLCILESQPGLDKVRVILRGKYNDEDKAYVRQLFEGLAQDGIDLEYIEFENLSNKIE